MNRANSGDESVKGSTGFEKSAKRTASDIGRANRRRGSEVERQVARQMGGKRMVMSGGSVLKGGDLIFPSDSIFHDFLWEVKARKKLPEIIHKALQQAGVDATGTLKKPAAVIKGDGTPPVVTFYLDDFVEWANALAEMGSGQQVKALVRDAKRILDQIERYT